MHQALDSLKGLKYPNYLTGKVGTGVALYMGKQGEGIARPESRKDSKSRRQGSLKQPYRKEFQMNKLATQKFMNLFNEMLTDRNGVGVKAQSFDKGELKDEIDLLNAHQEEKLSSRLSQRNLLFLKKVEAAKAKILDGSYGTCEDCGDDISQKRLLARPTASLCIGCQEAKENVEKHNINKRRDLAIGKGSENHESDDQVIAKQAFSNVNDIKFESVVDM